MTALGAEPLRHSQLAPAAPQPSLLALGSSPNVPLNRGLERALEEAASSGFLTLSARKLKEFPRTASNYDLTDTVDAGDLPSVSAL
ncbi:hypothetical protein MHYP_G00073380 [Metynnis hypsauchen]